MLSKESLHRVFFFLFLLSAACFDAAAAPVTQPQLERVSLRRAFFLGKHEGEQEEKIFLSIWGANESHRFGLD